MSHLIGNGASALAVCAADTASLSPVASLDPRTRILAAAAFAVVTVALQCLALMLIPLALALLALRAARLPAAPTLRRMAMVDGFILLLLLLLPFTVPGEPAFSLFGWPASKAGLAQAAAIALKANAVVLMLLSLVGSMDATVLGHALARLKVPENLVHLLLFTVRYITVVDGEYRRQRRAMRLRGFRARMDLHTLQSLGYLIGMLLVRALERSERILIAMRCRGFTGHLVLLDELRFARRDALFGVALGLLLGLLLTGDLMLRPGGGLNAGTA